MTQMFFEVDGVDRLRLEFNQFHQDNPHVWSLFKRYALQACHSGRKHYGAQTIIERIRYHNDIETVENGRNVALKLSNNHVAFYARMFHRHFPEHDGFFRVRPSAADEKKPAGFCNPTDLNNNTAPERDEATGAR